jgi:hypothetical protein
MSRANNPMLKLENGEKSRFSFIHSIVHPFICKRELLQQPHTTTTNREAQSTNEMRE